MRLLAELLMLPLTGPVRGLRFIAEQIQAEMDAVMMDEGRLEADLMNLSLQHDLGQIGGEQYVAQETYLLEQLDAIRAYREALIEEYQGAYDEGTLDDDTQWVDVANVSDGYTEPGTESGNPEGG